MLDGSHHTTIDYVFVNDWNQLRGRSPVYSTLGSMSIFCESNMLFFLDTNPVLGCWLSSQKRPQQDSWVGGVQLLHHMMHEVFWS